MSVNDLLVWTVHLNNDTYPEKLQLRIYILQAQRQKVVFFMTSNTTRQSGQFIDNIHTHTSKHMVATKANSNNS